MSVLDTVIINQVIPFEQFDIETDCDRIVLPVPSLTFMDAQLSFVPDGFGGVRLDPPAFIMHTYERAPDGWRRIK